MFFCGLCQGNNHTDQCHLTIESVNFVEILEDKAILTPLEEDDDNGITKKERNGAIKINQFQLTYKGHHRALGRIL